MIAGIEHGTCHCNMRRNGRPRFASAEVASIR
jgi:hypothetical protein